MIKTYSFFRTESQNLEDFLSETDKKINELENSVGTLISLSMMPRLRVLSESRFSEKYDMVLGHIIAAFRLKKGK